MTKQDLPNKIISVSAPTVLEVLSGSRFYLDYYQREYRWERMHISELVTDLSEKFIENYEHDHEREEVRKYDNYFLGSIITTVHDGKKFIIDGQQRLTSLTLLLLHIKNLLEDEDQRSQISRLIYSLKHGQKHFNLDIEERTSVMHKLMFNEDTVEAERTESVVNIENRYNDIVELMHWDSTNRELPFFADWLIEKVQLVEIEALTESDAYTIFETMNDRGLSLTPTEMLRGFLLSNIKDGSVRNKSANKWRELIALLRDSESDVRKDEDDKAIKAWLRGQYAETIREKKKGSEPGDFDRIGSEFHRWVRENKKRLSLSACDSYVQFIEDDFAFFATWYKYLRKASEELVENLKEVFYCAQQDFSLQYPILLASLCNNDSDSECLKKFQIVASYLDIVIARRIWQYRSTAYSTLKDNMFSVMRSIRAKRISELVEILTERLNLEENSFDTNPSFSLTGRNGPQIHRILARFTDFVENSSGSKCRFQEYSQRSGKNGYEIEHIWANNFSRENHKDDFESEEEFKNYRNRIGGLLLLPKSNNASYGDLCFKDKKEHYLKENLLAQSLHEKTYSRNPGFLKFVKESCLPFDPHTEFRRNDMDARQKLYIELAKEIWNPNRLEKIAVN